MKSTNEDIYNLVAPVFTVWKFAGFPIYNFKKNVGENTKFVNSTSGTLYLALLGITLLFTLSLWNIFSEMSDNVIVDDTINLTELIIFFTQNIGILILSHRKRKQIIRVVEALKYSESLIQRLTRRSVSYTIKAKNAVLKLVIVKYSLVVILCTIDSINLPEDKYNLMAYYFSWSFHYLFELVIFMYFIIVKNQYDEINRFLLSHNFKLKDSRTMKNLVSVYSLLREISHLIKCAFQSFLLMKAITDSIITSTAVFYIIRVYQVIPENFVLSTVSNVMFFTLISISNFTLAIVLHDVNTLFAAHTFLNKLEFFVCGLFPLNCTYIYWMITSVTGYVVYLVQFHKIV
ncbi:hypothetical protein Zmor_027132 [Zophobas morio]|uniref:Gustatory receptor n=1 Tax=Zophobas morio TaxID=2755281 RepID=A0AA38HMU7_9CUCU|nr:hypothetical protein Zmor_027132 [Zophobas morio]